MQYLLDTNICIYLIKQKPEKIIARFQTLSISEMKFNGPFFIDI